MRQVAKYVLVPCGVLTKHEEPEVRQALALALGI
jgi:hypothetical protein